MTDDQAAPLLLVGPVTNDLIRGERLAGGAVSYGAHVAAAFGIRARILTIGGPDADLSALEGHDVHLVEDEHTVTFAFGPGADGRTMRVPAQPSRPLSANDLPDEWRSPATLLIAPLIRGDLDVDSFAPIASAASQVGLITQGLQRILDSDDNVTLVSPIDNSLMRTCSRSYTFFRSRREAALWSAEQTHEVRRPGARVVTTRGADGALIEGESSFEVAAFPIDREVDTTGAGDVFATALILALDEGEQAAAQIAAAFAAASVEQIGPGPLPNLSEIKRRLHAARPATDEPRRGARA